jgi:GNAT superfamily N-acetyltransferase
LTVDRDTALALQRRNLAAFLGLLGRSSQGAHLYDSDGVRAAILPATPRRSVFNSVTYQSTSALIRALPRVADAYEGAGVRAWTVWVPEADREASEALEAAGHHLDAEPAAMVLELERLGDPDPGDLDWDDRCPPEVVGRINDLAYGHGLGSFGAAIAGVPTDAPLRFYQARVGGEPACVTASLDADGDCMIWYVATLPEHRGRGLASRLMHVALAAARERGCVTSSLQSSAMGEGIYAALGYRAYFRLRMYERRRP